MMRKKNQMTTELLIEASRNQVHEVASSSAFKLTVTTMQV